MHGNYFPQAGVGAVVFHNDAVLLVKRKNPPCANEWAIPGGRIKPGESLQQAAEREILGETGVHIQAGQPVYAFDLIEKRGDEILFHYVIVDLDATYLDGVPIANDDALEARWVTETEARRLRINTSTRTLLEEKYYFTV